MMKKFLTIAAVSAAAFLAVSCSEGTCELDGEWTVTEITGVNVADAEKQPILNIDANKKEYHGETGVNVINGNLKFGDGSITFEPGAMTKMMGAPSSMAVEDMYISIINSANSYEMIDENTAVIKNASGAQMTLTRK